MNPPYMVISGSVTPYLRVIDGFVLDLGTQVLNPQSRFHAKDTHLVEHLKMGGSVIQKLAMLGNIPVYVDESLAPMEVFIFHDGRSSYRRPSPDELRGDVHEYLEGMLQELFPE